MATNRELWLRNERARNKYYRKYTNVWRAYYNKTGTDIINAIKQDLPIEDVITYEDTEALFKAMYAETGSHFARLTFMNIKQGNLTFEQQMEMYVTTQVVESMSSVHATNLEQAQAIIRDVTATALEQELSMQQTARLIEQGVLSGWRKYGKWSSERIARTEIVAASNYGSVVGAERAVETGLQVKKIWLTGMDGRERDAHAEANGQEVRINESFIVGGQPLGFPGDKQGSPENVINCRCTVTYKTNLSE